MRKLSNLAIACWGAFAMLTVAGTSYAEDVVTANVTNGENIFKNGKGDVPACSSCHGDNAMGNDAMGSPRLANIGYVYIVKQLTNFAEDKRKDLTMDQMNGIAKGLTAQDRRDLAAYENSFPETVELSDLKQLKQDGTVIGESYKGEILSRFGVEGKSAACQSCHGYNGRGADPVYPKIGEQKYVYLVNQLTHWRDGSRANDPMSQMQKIARTLSDDDIKNVATYLSQAPDSTPGNGNIIDNQTVLQNIKIVH